MIDLEAPPFRDVGDSVLYHSLFGLAAPNGVGHLSEMPTNRQSGLLPCSDNPPGSARQELKLYSQRQPRVRQPPRIRVLAERGAGDYVIMRSRDAYWGRRCRATPKAEWKSSGGTRRGGECQRRPRCPQK
jgi:hypothetical protein